MRFVVVRRESRRAPVVECDGQPIAHATLEPVGRFLTPPLVGRCGKSQRCLETAETVVAEVVAANPVVVA